MNAPTIKKIRGSYFPPITEQGNSLYQVETLDGTVYYCGRSYIVARLINAVISPRTN